jgi:hypothetical protein
MLKKPWICPGVQVDGDHPVDARGGDEVGHQLGVMGVRAGDLSVLPGVAVVRDDGGDRVAALARRSASAMISSSMMESLTGAQVDCTT